MKILFVYFKSQEICSSVEDAVNFINSLHERGNENACKLEINETTRKNLENMFNGDFVGGTKIRTTGCGNTDIIAYEPLGDTIAEHKAAYKKIQKGIEAARKNQELEYFRSLHVQRNGWYRVALKVSTSGPLGPRPCFVYTCEVEAASGLEAQKKAVQKVEYSNPDFNIWDSHVRFLHKS